MERQLVEAEAGALDAFLCSRDPAYAVSALVAAARRPDSRRLALAIADRIIERMREQLATVETIRRSADGPAVEA